MRVFVYEYACAQLSAAAWRVWCDTGVLPVTNLPVPLIVEGRAMRDAVVQDLSKIAAVEALTLQRDHGQSEEALFCACARAADYSLLIAPESGGMLAERCRWVEREGGRLLGPSSEAVELTADKLRCGQHLTIHGIRTPPSHPITSSDFAAISRDITLPAVIKPRDGAGSQATFLVSSVEDISASLAQAKAEGWHGDAIVQPYHAGLPASVSFLIGKKQRIALCPTAQELSSDGRFHYLGGRLPLPDALSGRAIELGLATVEVIAGLRGYVGVDLVLGEKADGSDDYVIEINPRLTTSYVGLRASTKTNLAETWLRLVDGEEVAAPQWLPGETVFRASGEATRS